MRRFPTIVETDLGFEGAPMAIVCGGVAILIGAAIASRYFNEDRNIEQSKRHHPKGIGYSSINKQKDWLRNTTKKVQPNLDENYYEYSRHNPLRQR